MGYLCQKKSASSRRTCWNSAFRTMSGQQPMSLSTFLTTSFQSRQGSHFFWPAKFKKHLEFFAWYDVTWWRNFPMQIFPKTIILESYFLMNRIKWASFIFNHEIKIKFRYWVDKAHYHGVKGRVQRILILWKALSYWLIRTLFLSFRSDPIRCWIFWWNRPWIRETFESQYRISPWKTYWRGVGKSV